MRRDPGRGSIGNDAVRLFSGLVFLLAAHLVASCAHTGDGRTTSRIPLDRERFPNDCDDGNPFTTDDSMLGGICHGIADPDGDGIPNFGAGPLCSAGGVPEGCVDNCRFTRNPDQADSDADGLGDACERVAEWNRVDTTEKVVALTFDDGYNDAALNRILDALDAVHARGTFFLNGLYLENGSLKKATLERLRDGGHLLGNHTYHHTLGADAETTRTEIREGERAFLDLAGISLHPLFRSPAYARTAWRDEVLHEEGYSEHLLATLDLEDWTEPPPSPAAMTACVAGEVEPGDIILFHAGPHTTPVALPGILRALADRGYGFVTIEELLFFGEPTFDEAGARLCRRYYH